MTTQLSFSKNPALQNLLFDEYFAEYQHIEVIAFSYDGAGTALCRCDGEMAEINKSHLHRIIFGADRQALETFLQGIFDPEAEAEELHRINDTLVFRLAELRGMKKYDVANLAKQTMKAVHDHGADPFRYFILDGGN